MRICPSLIPVRSVAVAIVSMAWGAGCAPAAEESAELAVRAADVSLPADIHLLPAEILVSARVLPGTTMASLLRAHQIAEAEVADLVARASAIFDLRRVRIDQPYRFARALDGALRWFEYEIDGDRLLKIARAGQQPAPVFVAEIVAIEKTAQTVTVRGAIGPEADSLVASMDQAGETIDLSLALAGIFASDVDFNVDLQSGDRYELVVDKLFRENGQFAGYGPILAAELYNAGRRLRAVRFEPEGGPAGYFDDNGRSLRKFFLRSPLKFEPVMTSGFSRRRFHPVLQQYRAHQGVDYRAPTGAPVVAVAAGTVVFAGYNGGSGRMVHLRHANGFETQYLHLSSIAVRSGARVSQGDLVGRVGATGLATGPHLHYAVKRNGVNVNPVAVHRAMPPGDPIPSADLARFAEARDRAFSAITPSSVVVAGSDVSDLPAASR
jgi:murein DD-endopeptidase MepM/ murein hydrolase activator NlpD